MEEYNSDKSVMRVTTDRVPNTSALMKDTAIPLGVIVKPYGDPATVSLVERPNLNRERRCRRSAME